MNMQFDCELCPTQTKEKFTFFGNENAEIMLVFAVPHNENGSAVSMTAYDENILRSLLSLYDVSLETVYVTTLVKCLSPYSEDRANTCIDYLRKQFRKIRPKKIICFGQETARWLIDKNFNLNESHGQCITKASVDFMGTFDITKYSDDKEVRLNVLSDLNDFLG